MKAIIRALLFQLLSSSLGEAATYYIDPSAATNGNGSQASPYNSWASVSFAAGNTYLQKAGTNYNSVLSISNVMATSGSPIIIDRYGTGADPIIRAQSVGGIHFFTFQHLNIPYGVITDLNNGVTDNVWQFNDIANPGMHAFYLQGPTARNIVQNNTIHDAPGIMWCMVVAGSGHTQGNGDQILNNTIYNCGQYGIDFWYSSWNLASGNIVHDTGTNSAGGGSGTHMYNGGFGAPFGTVECHDNTYTKNVVYHASDHLGDGNGVQVDQACHNNTVTDNLYFANDGEGISLFDTNNNLISGNYGFNNGMSRNAGSHSLCGEIDIDACVPAGQVCAAQGGTVVPNGGTIGNTITNNNWIIVNKLAGQNNCYGRPPQGFNVTSPPGNNTYGGNHLMFADPTQAASQGQNMYYIWSSLTGGSNQAVWNGASPGGDSGIVKRSDDPPFAA